MPNPRDTIKNRIQRALLQIAESPDASAQERFEAVAMILKVRELQDGTTPGKQSKRPSYGALGNL